MNNPFHKLCSDHTQQLIEVIKSDSDDIRRAMQTIIINKRVEDSYAKDLLGLIARGHFNFIDSIFIRLALRGHYLDATRNVFYDTQVFKQ